MNSEALIAEFTAFRDTCVWLRNCYNTFNYLYYSGSETKGLLERTAPLFFSDPNQILLEYFFIQVRKITDPSKTLGRENLSISNVNDGLVRVRLMTSEIGELTARITQYRELTKEIVNRLAAHADKETLLSLSVVGEHSEAQIESFMADLQLYTDAVGNALGIGPLDYQTQAGAGDVQDLLTTLKTSLTLERR